MELARAGVGVERENRRGNGIAAMPCAIGATATMLGKRIVNAASNDECGSLKWNGDAAKMILEFLDVAAAIGFDPCALS